MTPDEHEAVKEILLDRLHTTGNEELGAALWQLLESHDRLERRNKLASMILAN
jgi:hypothetical protein